jgi:predicted transposase YdaD
LGELYKLATGDEIALPQRYKQIFNERTIEHIRSLLAAKYLEEEGDQQKEQINHGSLHLKFCKKYQQIFKEKRMDQKGKPLKKQRRLGIEKSVPTSKPAKSSDHKEQTKEQQPSSTVVTATEIPNVLDAPNKLLPTTKTVIDNSTGFNLGFGTLISGQG